MITEICRICLQGFDSKEKNMCKLDNRFFSPYRSVKEMIIKCVPEMGAKISNEDTICEPCLVELDISYNFILKCQNTEKRIQVAKAPIQCSSDQTPPSSNFIALPLQYVLPPVVGVILCNTNQQVVGGTRSAVNNVGNMHLKISEGNAIGIQTQNVKHEARGVESVVHNSESPGEIVDLTSEVEDTNINSELNESSEVNDHDYLSTKAETKLNLDTFSKSSNVSKFNRILSVKQDDSVLTDCITKLKARGLDILCYPSKDKRPENNQTKRIIFLGTTNNIYECNICTEEFTDYRQLKNHNKIHTKISLLGNDINTNDCSICKEKFDKVGLLYKHMNIAHRDIKPFKCEVCFKSYRDRYNFKTHKCSSQTQIKTYVCAPCNLTFEDVEEYKKHSSEHLNFLCEKCGKAFSKPESLKFHIQVHNERTYGCQFCDRKFRYKQLLRNHEKIHSNRVKSYLCDQCPKSYYTIGRLRKHINSHMGIKNFQCEICKKRFVSSSSLKQHVTVQHLGIKPYQCEICMKFCTKKAYLQAHMKRHEDTKSKVPYWNYTIRKTPSEYECRLCGKKSKNNEYMKIHLNTHLRIRNHKCNICGLSFMQKMNLNKHIKTHMLEKDKMFRCDLCYKKFSTKEEVDLHFPTHKRPKRYQCFDCGELFGRRYLLENHRKVAHETSDVEDFDIKDLMKVVYPDE